MSRVPIEGSTGRTVQIGGRELVFFGGSSYLALSHHPRVLAALAESAAQYGLSAGASRETTGNSVEHELLEVEIARAVGVESALLCPDGFTANVALAQALAHDHALAVIDEGAHPSLFDAARAVGMEIVKFEHRSARHAGELMRRGAARGVVLFTDGVFPSEGTLAPIDEFAAALPDDRAVLFVDDCHGFGILGPRGAGTCAAFGVVDPRLAITVTLSKAFGVYGGAICARRSLIERARAHSQAYLGTTPIPPPLARAAREALAVHFEDLSLLTHLLERVHRIRARLAALDLCSIEPAFPVIGFALESSAAMQALHDKLLADGLFAPYIHYHGGPPSGFFRIVLNAAHTDDDLESLASGLERHLGPATSRRAALQR